MTTSTEVPTTHTSNRRFVPLGELRLEFGKWTNPRTMTGLGDAEIEEFSKNIKNGIEVPPHVAQIRANGDIVNLVIDGQRRVLAARKVFDKDTPIEVIDVEPIAVDLTPDKAAELTERALNISTNRAALSSYELCEAAARLRDQGLSNGKIGKAIHKSDTWVSKMLTARDSATPKLTLAWQRGEITDEQFKDIARQKSASDQNKALDDVKVARESGDKASARAVAKEVAATTRVQKEEAVEKADRVINGHNTGHKPVVTGPQEGLFSGAKAESKPERKPDDDGPKAASKAVLTDMLELAKKKPPTHDYVKGVLDGVRVALGFTNPDKLGKPWVTYLARVEGKAVVKKAKAKKAAKKSKKSKR
jgi:hypothetical protein